MKPLRFKQRPPRLSHVFQCIDQPIYFVTFVTAARRPWLACEAVHVAFTTFARRAFSEHGVAVGKYVIMPDHLHLIVTGPNLKLGRWVGLLKQVLAKSGMKSASEKQIWQEGFFDRLLRSDENLDAKWQYIAANPVRAGLVTAEQKWPLCR